ncbi:hypothetical protein [Clostridium sp. B9]|uniref:hypothetical protein n=1 Tax=Clostridium sp. B9 TaxID=3423224 RepID=UPI003D2EF473
MEFIQVIILLILGILLLILGKLTKNKLITVLSLIPLSIMLIHLISMFTIAVS